MIAPIEFSRETHCLTYLAIYDLVRKNPGIRTAQLTEISEFSFSTIRLHCGRMAKHRWVYVEENPKKHFAKSWHPTSQYTPNYVRQCNIYGHNAKLMYIAHLLNEHDSTTWIECDRSLYSVHFPWVAKDQCKIWIL